MVNGAGGAPVFMLVVRNWLRNVAVRGAMNPLSTLLTLLFQCCHVYGDDGFLESPHLADSATIARLISSRRLISRAAAEAGVSAPPLNRSEEHTSELQSQSNLVCRLLLEKKK